MITPGKHVLWTVLAAWSLLMGYLLLTPDEAVTSLQLFKGQDKVAHLVLFAVWSGLFYLALGAQRGFDSRTLWTVFACGLALATLTEGIQHYQSTRSAELLDLLMDMVGCVLGCGFGYFLKKELFRVEKKFDK